MKNQIFLFIITSHLMAHPSGMEVKHGEVVGSLMGHELTITQLSDKAIVHWEDFSIQKGELTRFLQPSSDAAILNRVTGSLPSSIQGILRANGKVYLINPQGILIGPEGRIETNRFVAATLDIANEEFLAQSEIYFKGNSNHGVINLGVIQAEEGDVFLIAREVENKGGISAKTVGLAGGSEVLLVPEGTQRIFIQPQLSGKVENQGVIEAIQAELRAAGGSIYGLALNQSGVIEVEGIDSLITLQAEKGWIAAKGNCSSHGGSIHILGEHINLIEDCMIDASGAQGGGEILVGEIPRAQSVYVGPNVSIYSDALEKGNGGKVTIWGEDDVHFYGSICSKGGKSGGDGGFVEISSHKSFDYQGKVNTLAPCGKTGMFLIDPSDITISTAASSPAFPTSPGMYNPPGASATLNNGDLQTGLGSSNITVTTSGGTGGTGNITWSAAAPITWAAATTLTLNADAAISLGSNITNTGTGSFTALNFTANSGGATAGTFVGINILAGVTISSSEGAIIMNGTGGGGGVANGNIGIRLNAGTIIQSTGSGASAATISLTGVGGAAASANNYGVQINGASAQVTSVDGAIQITGSSGATPGAGNTNNHGIFVSGGGSILSTGTTPGASINLNGTGGAAQSTNIGVYVNGANSLVSSVNGAIQITGVGGAGATTSNAGVQIDSAGVLSSTGTGSHAASITIMGTGGAGTNNNDGIFVTGANSRINTADGNITLIGVGAGPGTTNRGVEVVTNGAIQYGGSSTGTISLTGTGSGTSGTGVRFSGSLGIIATSSSPKDIFISGVDSSDTGIIVADPLGNANSTGNITLEADTINPSGSIIQTTGQILIEPKNPSTSIGLAGGAGTLSLSTAQLNTIQSGSSSLTIGRSNGTSTMTVRAYTFNTNVILQDSDLVIQTGPVTTGASNSITLNADTMAIGAAVTGTGALTIQPFSSSSVSIGLGNGATGTLNLDSTELGNLGATFTSITFGQALETGDVDMQTFTYSDPIIVNGQTINVNGVIHAGSNNITFNIGPASAGTLNLSNPVTTTGTFQVNGGSNNDAFNIITTSAQTASLNGNGGTNNLTGPNVANTWTITGNNAGTLNTSISFSNMQNLIGGTLADDFTFNGAFQITTGIDGGAGNNSVTGPNVANTWTITADNTATVTPTGAAGTTTLANIQSLIGGAAADSFHFNGAFQMSAATGIDGGAGSNTIQAPPNVFSDWTISSSDGGSFNPTGATGPTIFANIGNLSGGTSSTNTFTLNAGGSLSGAINGTSSSGNSLIYSAGYGVSNVTLTSNAADGTATGIGALFNIQTFTGSSSGSNQFTGPNGTNNWVITSSNAGTLNGSLVFNNFPNLTGGTGNDTFDFTSGATVSGLVDGGAGSNTLEGPSATINVWNISNTDQGNVGSITFANIGNLIGGNRTDIFSFADQKGVTGSINGGGSTGNTLDYSLYTIPARIFPITATSGTASNLGAGYSNIYSIIGNFTIILPSPITFSSNIIREAVTLAQIAIISTQNFLELGDTWDSIAYGQYGSPLDEVFDWSKFKKVKLVKNGLRLSRK